MMYSESAIIKSIQFHNIQEATTFMCGFMGFDQATDLLEKWFKEKKIRLIDTGAGKVIDKGDMEATGGLQID